MKSIQLNLAYITSHALVVYNILNEPKISDFRRSGNTFQYNSAEHTQNESGDTI